MFVNNREEELFNEDVKRLFWRLDDIELSLEKIYSDGDPTSVEKYGNSLKKEWNEVVDKIGENKGLLESLGFVDDSHGFKDFLVLNFLEKTGIEFY